MRARARASSQTVAARGRRGSGSGKRRAPKVIAGGADASPGGQLVALRAADGEAPRKRIRPSAIPAHPLHPGLQLDREAQVQAVIRDFMSGSFQQAASFADGMLGDDRIAGIFATRIGALVASDIEFDGATTKRKAVKIAELLGGSDDEPGIWGSMAPLEAIG